MLITPIGKFKTIKNKPYRLFIFEKQLYMENTDDYGNVCVETVPLYRVQKITKHINGIVIFYIDSFITIYDKDIACEKKFTVLLKSKKDIEKVTAWLKEERY